MTQTFDQPAAMRERTQTLTLAAMCIAQFMIMLDVTIVNIALPSMQRELHMTAGGLEWVVSAYALSLAALIPFGGALGDRYGRKRWFLIGMTIFTLASIACALSTSSGELIGFRAVQGIGGAVMSALTLSILTQAYPPEKRAHAIGTWGALGGLGFGAGPVIGGLLLTGFGWSSVFWVNVPFAVGGLALAVTVVQESHQDQTRRLDWPGVASSALGLVGVTLGLIESSSHSWGSALVLGSLIAGVVLLAAFIVIEGRVRAPMVPLALLRSRSFASGVGLYLGNYVALTGVLFFMTLLYQDVAGWSVLHTGLTWLFMNGPFVLIARFAGRLHARFSSRAVVTAGALVFAVGTFLLSRVTLETSFVLTAIGYVCAGFGAGALVPGVAHIAMRDVPKAVSGAASGVLNAGRQVGTSIGLAVLGAISVHAATSKWATAITSFPHAVRGAAAAQAQNVGAGQVNAVSRSIGGRYHAAAVASFIHGEQLALTIAALCLLVAAALGWVGLRRFTPVPAA